MPTGKEFTYETTAWSNERLVISFLLRVYTNKPRMVFRSAVMIRAGTEKCIMHVQS
jgi:hypothetical protein